MAFRHLSLHLSPESREVAGRCGGEASRRQTVVDGEPFAEKTRFCDSPALQSDPLRRYPVTFPRAARGAGRRHTETKLRRCGLFPEGAAGGTGKSKPPPGPERRQLSPSS